MGAAVVIPETETGTRVRFLPHADAAILLIDLSYLTSAHAILAEIRTARELIARQPAASLRTVTLVRGARYTPVVVEALRELMVRNRPFVRAAAVVGMEGMQRVLYRVLMLFTRRQVEAFDEVEPAVAWLKQQG